MKITEYFAGYVICTAKNNKIRAVNLMNRRGIGYYGLYEKDGAVTFRIRRRDAKRNPDLISLCDNTLEAGFSVFLCKRMRRPGLIVGFLIFALVLFISGLFVWDVTLTTGGNENAERIMNVLKENGLKPGAVKSNIDKRKLENTVMLSCPDVSFISVNMTGNTVSVRTDERVIKEREENGGPCDLTAGEDGYVLRFETYKGQAVCEAGKAVKRGDVLISGLVETKHHGYETVRSSGKVFAVVKRSYLVKTSAEYKEKYYTGNEYESVDVSVFSNDFNVKRDGHGEYCDVFESTGQLSVRGLVYLPVYVKKTVFREYAYMTVKRNEEQIKEELKRLSKEQFTIVTEGCEVRSSTETVYEKNGVYYLYCDVWCVADIAKETPIRTNIEENRK